MPPKKKSADAKAAKKQKQEEKISRKNNKNNKSMFGGEDIDAILAEFATLDKKANTVQYDIVEAPSERTSSVFTHYNNQLFLFGGEMYDGRKVVCYNETYVYNLAKHTWTKLTIPNAPNPRSSASYATHDSKLYIFGGDFTSPNQQFKHWNDLWCLDLANLTWEKVSTNGPTPSVRSGHRMCIVKRKLYIFGGFYDNGTSVVYYNDFFSFDLNTMTYEKISDKGALSWPNKRSGFGMTYHEPTNSIIVCGGYSTAEKKKGAAETANVLNDLWKFDLNTNQWTSLKSSGENAPTNVSSFTMFSVKNRILVFGGCTDVDQADSISSTFYNQVREYNLRTKTWETLQLNCGIDPSHKHVEEAMDDNDTPEEKKKKKEAMEDLAAQQLKAASAWKWGGDDKPTKGKRFQDDSDSDSDVDDSSILINLGVLQLDDEAEQTVKIPNRLAYVWPRRSSHITVVNNSVYLFGGAFERGDCEVTLNDLHLLDMKKGTWRTLYETDLSKQTWFDDDESDDEEDDKNSSGKKRRHEDDDEDDEDDEDEEDGIEHPKMNKGEGVRDYFNRCQEHWMSEATMEADKVLSDKDLKKFAFKLCEQAVKRKEVSY